MKAIGFDLGWYPFDSQLFENMVIKSQITGKFSVKTCLKYHEYVSDHIVFRIHGWTGHPVQNWCCINRYFGS